MPRCCSCNTDRKNTYDEVEIRVQAEGKAVEHDAMTETGSSLPRQR